MMMSMGKPIEINPPDVIKWDFKFVKELGRGAYGVACLYQHADGSYYVIKLESKKQTSQALTAEALIMKKLTFLGFVHSPAYN